MFLDLTNFFGTTQGITTVVLVMCGVVAFFMASLYKKHVLSTKALSYSAVCVAMAIVLNNIAIFRMPQGGSVSLCSMLFIVLVAYWFGPLQGILAGTVLGLADLAINPYVIHPMQMLLDYPFAFGALGIGGIFRNKKYGLHIAYVVGCFSRFLVSFLSGYIFFRDVSAGIWDGMIYSVIYNMSYILPEMIATLALISVPVFNYTVTKVKFRTSQ